MFLSLILLIQQVCLIYSNRKIVLFQLLQKLKEVADKMRGIHCLSSKPLKTVLIVKEFRDINAMIVKKDFVKKDFLRDTNIL